MMKNNLLVKTEAKFTLPEQKICEKANFAEKNTIKKDFVCISKTTDFLPTRVLFFIVVGVPKVKGYVEICNFKGLADPENRLQKQNLFQFRSKDLVF